MLDFPPTPAVNDLYPVPPVAGVPQYKWDGEKWVALDSGIVYLPLTGGTLSGFLTLHTNPANALHAAPKQYVDATAAAAAAAYVAKTGDTMTGQLTASGGIVSTTLNTTGAIGSNTTISSLGNISTNGDVSAAGGQMGIVNQGSVRYLLMHNGNAWQLNMANGQITWLQNNNAIFYMGSDSSLNIVSDAAFKAGGGPWLAPSDARIKNVLGDYTTGLDAIAALRPIRYTYRGNDTSEPPQEGVVSRHNRVAEAGKQFVGLVGQEIEVAMPETVSRFAGYIDGAAVSDMRVLDTGPILYALINAVKELKARVEALEAGGP